jgi:hypothetical protein
MTLQVLVSKLQSQMIQKLKDAGNMLTYSQAHLVHQITILTLVVVQVMNFM